MHLDSELVDRDVVTEIAVEAIGFLHDQGVIRVCSEEVDHLREAGAADGLRGLVIGELLDYCHPEPAAIVQGGGALRGDRESLADSRFMHLLRVGMARKYVENLSEEVRKGMRQKCAEGGWPTYAPVGYLQVKETAEKKRTGGIIPDPAKAPLIVQLFDAAATRAYSLGSLARLADRIGLRGARGARLGKQQVANILGNTAYFGEFTWGGEMWRGKYEPLVSRDLYDRANREGNRRRGRMSSPSPAWRAAGRAAGR